MKVVVFFYEGEAPDQSTIGDLAFHLGVECGADNIQTFVGDETAIAQAIVKDIQNNKEVEVENLTPEDRAVILVGETFKGILGADYTKVGFVLELTKAMFNAKKHPGQTKARALINALFILSQEDLRISASLLEKYNLDEEKLLLIKEVYTCALKK